MFNRKASQMANRNEAFMRMMKRHRMAKGMTMNVLSRKLGVSVATVHAWESGRNLPRPDMVPKLARIFEIDPMELTRVISPDPTMPARPVAVPVG